MSLSVPAAMRGLVTAFVLTVLTACRAATPLPPPWPESADIDLRAEIEATEADLADTAPDSGGSLLGEYAGAPLVQALEDEAAGLAYIEVVLGDVGIDDTLPMVLMLHGRGDRPRVPGGPFACVTVPMRIIMPRAPDPLGSGFTWLSVRVAEGRTQEISEQLAGRADQVADLLRDVAARRPTSGRPIVTGFSQGGLLTFALAVRNPGLVAAAMPLAGWLPPPLWPASAEGLPPLRLMHGTIDDTIPLPPTRDAVAYVQGLGADVELREFDEVGHRMTGEMNALFERWLGEALRREAPDLAVRALDTSVEQEGLDSGQCLDEP